METIYNEAKNFSVDKEAENHVEEKCSVNTELSEDISTCTKQPISDQKTQEIITNDTQEKLFVFVSFSMPIESLKQLSKDADRHGAILILRGLKNNSFKETAKFIETLGKDMEGGFEINPELFEQYKIKHVPVFILVKKDIEVSRLSGNISLGFAMKKLKEG